MTVWPWHDKRIRGASFWGMVMITVLPLVALPLISQNYHRLHRMPSVKNGIIDLSGYDFFTHPEIPLSGEWEFYYDRFLVSEPEETVAPQEAMVSKEVAVSEPAAITEKTAAPKEAVRQGKLVPVPSPWTSWPAKERELSAQAKASYRLLLENSPRDIPLVIYIPNINSSYRVYIDGELVSSKGNMDLQGTPVRGGGNPAEVVIELQSPHIGGLYVTPVIGEQERLYVYREARNFIAAICIGILLVSIGCIVCFMFFRDKLLSSVALVVMDILVCLHFLVRDEFLVVLRNMIRGLRFYTIYSLLRIATFFLPFIFLFCIRQLIHIRLRKRLILLIGAYELLLSPFLWRCMLKGEVRAMFFICLAGYLPFLLIGKFLYREVLKKTPYSLLVSAVFLFTISSIISAAMADSGQLVMSTSLFSPLCFVIAMVFQLALYIWRSFELQRQAAAAENLRLRLRDSELSLMLSQIQPHFIYNTLIAIYMLCLEKPQIAAETTLKFATFLRTNMRFIHDPKPVPFIKELEHIRNYADIEQIRFKDRLRMRYQIEATDFNVPALTVQPLVENAIRHGVTKNVDGGEVILHTFETADAFRIEVIDDGPGFDTGILESCQENSFGIRNVSFRLREQLQAQIGFESIPGKGTTVWIRIPKGGSK